MYTLLSAKPKQKKRISLILAGLILLSLCACGKKTADPGKQQPQQEITESDQDQPEQNSPQDETASEPDIEPAPALAYDYSQPVPQRDEVDNAYFDDAVFIGNSQTEGFSLYSGLKNPQTLSGIGLSVKGALNDPVFTVNGKKQTILDALAQMNFSKVYLLFGANELGWVYSSIFIKDYGLIIDHIREVNPDVVIYIQSILPVSAKKSSGDSVFNNTKIGEYNELLRAMAEEKQVCYVNVSEALSDETGNLPDDAASDGMHLTPTYCKLWLEYLKTHTIQER